MARPPTRPIRPVVGPIQSILNSVPAVIYAVDNPSNPQKVSVLLNDQFPPISGYTWPASIKTTFTEAPNPFVAPPTGGSYWVNHTTLTGGTQVMVDTVNRVVVGVANGYSTLAPYNYQNDYVNIRHNGAYNGLWQNPQPIDMAQLAANPNPSNPPQLASGYVAPLGVTAFAPASGAYDAKVTFGVTTAGTTTSTWLGEIRTYAVPHGNAWVKNVGLKASVAPNASGVYSAVWDGLNSGTSYDLYISYLDLTAVETPATLIATTAANPFVIGTPNLANGALSNSPSFSAVVAAPTKISATNSTTWDAQASFTLDSLGYNTNTWLNELELIAKPTGSPASSYQVYGTLSPITSGAYSAYWAGIGLGQNYDLSVRYIDYAGNRSAAAVVASGNGAALVNVNPGNLAVAYSSLPGNPSPSTPPAFSVSPTLGTYTRSGLAGTFDAPVSFTLNPTTAPLWLAAVRMYAVKTGGAHVTTQSGLSTLTLKGAQTAVAGSAYNVIYELASGTAWDLYIAYEDYQGTISAPTYMVTTAANPQIIGTTNQASGATGINPAPTSIGTPSAIGVANSTDDVTITFGADANGTNSNNWLAEIQLVTAPNGTNVAVPSLWQQAGALAPQSSSAYTGIWARLGANNVYDLGIRYVDYQGNFSNTYVVASNYTVPALVVGTATLKAMPSAVQSAGPTLTSATQGGPLNQTQPVTIQIAASDYDGGAFGIIPSWGRFVRFIIRQNGTNNIVGQPNDQPFTTNGTINATLVVPLGMRCDFGVQYIDHKGNTSAIIWHTNWRNVTAASSITKSALLGDTSGDITTPLSDGTKFTHLMMSQGLQSAISDVGVLVSSGPFNSIPSFPGLLAPTDFVLTYTFPAGTTNISYYFNGAGGSGSNVTFYFPNGGTGLAPWSQAIFGSAATPIVFPIGSGSGSPAYLLFAFNPKSGAWMKTIQATPITLAQMQAAAADGWLLTSPQTASGAMTTQTIGSGAGGSRTGGRINN